MSRKFEIFTVCFFLLNFFFAPCLVADIFDSKVLGFQYFLCSGIGLPIIFFRIQLQVGNKYLEQNKDLPNILNRRYEEMKTNATVKELSELRIRKSKIETKLHRYKADNYRINSALNIFLILLAICTFISFFISYSQNKEQKEVLENILIKQSVDSSK
jgi:hypothetical protein